MIQFTGSAGSTITLNQIGLDAPPHQLAYITEMQPGGILQFYTKDVDQVDVRIAEIQHSKIKPVIYIVSKPVPFIFVGGNR